MKRLFVVILVVLTLCSCNSGVKSDLKTLDKKDSAVQLSKSDEKKPAEISGSDLIKNSNARLAIAHAIDKSFIEDVILGDGSRAVDYFVSRHTFFNDSGKDFREKYPDGFLHYDLNKAIDYWKKAKEELKFDKVTIHFLTYDQETRLNVSEYIQSTLMKNLEGLEIVLDIQPFDKKLISSAQGNFDIELDSWAPDYADPMTFLDVYMPDSKLNNARYNSQEYREILMSAKHGDLSKDQIARWIALQNAERILLERDIAIVPLYQNGYSFLQSVESAGIVRRNLPPEFTYAYATNKKLTDGKRIIRIPIDGDLMTLNSLRSYDFISLTAIGNVIDGLVEVDGTGKIIPNIAKKWDVSSDSLKYTFYLRDDVKWSNGAKVTAHDFEFAWKLLANPLTEAEYQSLVEVAGIKNSKKIVGNYLNANTLGVRAIDDFTLECELEVAVPFFVRMLSFPAFYPINEKFYNEHIDNYGTNVANTLYCGPYVMNKWSPGNGYQIKKNQNYYNASAVNNDGVNALLVKDVKTGIDLYSAGELDLCQISGIYSSTLSARPDFSQSLSGRSTYLVFNLDGKK